MCAYSLCQLKKHGALQPASSPPQTSPAWLSCQYSLAHMPNTAVTKPNLFILSLQPSSSSKRVPWVAGSSSSHLPDIVESPRSTYQIKHLQCSSLPARGPWAASSSSAMMASRSIAIPSVCMASGASGASSGTPCMSLSSCMACCFRLRLQQGQQKLCVGLNVMSCQHHSKAYSAAACCIWQRGT